MDVDQEQRKVVVVGESMWRTQERGFPVRSSLKIERIHDFPKHCHFSEILEFNFFAN